MKTRRILSLAIAAILIVTTLAVVGLVNVFAATPIASADQFMEIFSGKEVSGNYTLTASFTLPDDYVTATSFTGTLDGGSFTVSGIKTPLFNTLAGEVKNLTLEGAITSDSDSALGTLACTVSGDLTLEKITNSTSISAEAASYVGGLLGKVTGLYTVTVTDCHNTANVTGGSVVGGLVGGVISDTSSQYTTLSMANVSNRGNVHSTVVAGNVGTAGILGYTGKGGEAIITRAVNYGTITMQGGDSGVGGIFGGTSWSTDRNEKITVTYSMNFGDVYVSGEGQRGRAAGIAARVNKNGSMLTIDHCANFGTISAMQAANDGAGGIFGYAGSGAISGSVTNCYNVGAISAKSSCNAIGNSGDADLVGSNNYYIVKPSSEGSTAMTSNGGSRMNGKVCADLNALIEAIVTESTDWIVEDGQNDGYPIFKWQCTHKKTTTTLTAELCEVCGIKLRDIEDTSTPFDQATIMKTGDTAYTVSTSGISAFASFRAGKTGGERDVRFLIAIDAKKLESFQNVTVNVAFINDSIPIKSLALDFKELTPYESAKAAGDTYTAAADDELYGVVVEGISNSAWESATLSITVSDGTVFSGKLTNPSTETDDPTDHASEIGVMTFNLRYDTTSHDLMALGVRGPHLMEIIDKYSPDSVGFNETTNNWMNWLRGNMAQRGYAYVGVGRDSGTDEPSKTGNSNEYSPIFYKADKYEVLTSDTIWLSKTPEIKSKGWGSGYNRICTYAVLKNKTTGEIYAHLSTHLDHKDMEAQENSIYILETYVRALLKAYGNIGVVVTGDFNTAEFQPNDPDYDAFTYNGITSFMDDTRYLATELGVIGKSFMGYDPEKWEQGYETDKDKPNIDTSAAPIDFIFVKKGAYTCSYYTVVNDTFTFDFGGKTWHEHPVSDHYGVCAKITCAKPETPFTKDETKLVDHKATSSTTKPSGLLPKLTSGITVKSTFGAADATNVIENLLKDDASFAAVSVSGDVHGYWEITLTPASDLNFRLNGISFTTASSDHPFNLRVFVSTDGKTWKQVGASYAEDLADSTTYYVKSEEILNAHYVKLAFTDTPNGAKLSNVSLYGETGSNGRVAPDRITVTAGPSFNSKEGCEKLFDGTTSTKFYKRQYTEGSVPAEREPMEAIVFTTDAPVTITHFNFINGNDTASHKGRIPSAWTLYGSTDGENYVAIDTETAPALTTDNYAVHTFTVDTPGSYQYYKLVFVCGNDGNVQFSEMELFETVK